MAVVLQGPPEIVSHTKGFQAESPAKQALPPAKRVQLRGALRRAIIQRYENTRNSYRSTRQFAREEQVRLRVEEGLAVTTHAIEALLARNNQSRFKWEILRDFLQKAGPDGHDMGTLLDLTGWSRKTVDAVMRSVQCLHGYVIERFPASPQERRERGWVFKYRIPPRGEERRA